MGIFKKKDNEDKPKLSPNETALKIAHNVFKNTLLDNETIKQAISGKCDAENIIFSVGAFAVTDKRLLYYFQNGSKTGVETIMFDKIISILSISGVENKMGAYIGVAVELANGKKRIVRCANNQEQKDLIKEFIFAVESKR